MVEIIQGDCREKLRELKDKSVHCVVTSPPYYGLRDYLTARWEGGKEDCTHSPADIPKRRGIASSTLGGGKKTIGHQHEGYKDVCQKCGAQRVDNQIGLEQTPEMYVQNLVEVFREVKRVLRDDGTVWLNLGDSYNGSGKGRNGDGSHNIIGKQATNVGSVIGKLGKTSLDSCKPKDLLGIPWRVAFALQSDGWYLRSDVIEQVELYCPCGCGYVLEERIWRYSQDREIIWNKPNPMPESVTDRPTKSHEYIFLLSKSARYFYDAEAIKEKQAEASFERAKYGWNGRTDDNSNGARTGSSFKRMAENGEKMSVMIPANGYRNKRSVWTIATTPYTGAHFATYPPELIAPCIQAGTSEHGCCPKCGAPWERILEVQPMKIKRSSYGVDSGNRTAPSGTMIEPNKSKTIGWQPTCTCGMDKKIPKEELDADPSLIDDFEIEPFEPIPCTVLDPFAGSGTTGEVCETLGRDSILIELNPQYIELIRQRTGQKGLFAS